MDGPNERRTGGSNNKSYRSRIGILFGPLVLFHNTRGMFGRDVLLLEGNGTNGAGKLSLLRDAVFVVRATYLLRFRTFLKVTSLAFGASNLD